jgi:hypothetical protein
MRKLTPLLPVAMWLLIAVMGGRGAEITGGTLEDGRYHHNGTRVEFAVPAPWTLQPGVNATGGGELVTLRHQPTGTELHVWMMRDATAPAQVRRRLTEAVAEKVEQRRGSNLLRLCDRATYAVVPERIRPATINGRDAVRAVAQFTSRDDTLMAEDMTWIYSASTRVFFFAKLPVSAREAMRDPIDAVVTSALVP